MSLRPPNFPFLITIHPATTCSCVDYCLPEEWKLHESRACVLSLSPAHRTAPGISINAVQWTSGSLVLRHFSFFSFDCLCTLFMYAFQNGNINRKFCFAASSGRYKKQSIWDGGIRDCRATVLWCSCCLSSNRQGMWVASLACCSITTIEESLGKDSLLSIYDPVCDRVQSSPVQVLSRVSNHWLGLTDGGNKA